MNRFSSSAKPGTSKLIIAALLCAFVIAAKGTTGQEQEEGEDCGSWRKCYFIVCGDYSAGECAPGLYCDTTNQNIGEDLPGTCKPTSSIPRQEVHRYWKSRKDHFYTTSLTEIGVSKLGAVGNYGYKYEGVGFRILANQVEGTKALLRYWKPESTDHLYTTNQNEINVTKVGAVGNHGYKLEGQLGFCFADARGAETVPLYRYFNKVFKDHFYTTNFKELGWGNESWNHEGIQCYVYPA